MKLNSLTDWNSEMTNENKATTLSRFLEYAADAGNWGGTPWVQHANVSGAGTKENNGYIVNMKKRGWITTWDQDGEAVMYFTDEGKALAAEHGINL
jgi:hypothetical protein